MPTHRSLRTFAARLSLLTLALASAAALPDRAAAQDAAAPAPLSLSDADGQQLTLEALDVRTAVHGMLALTEMEIRFRNPHGRRMEGRFTAVLPEGATVSRFAKEVNGALVEGEVVERLRANQVYDQILQQMRDPALLEQDQGNRFSARIFPIEAGATVRVVLGYSQLLPLRGGERAYVLPLRGLPRVGLFTFRGSFVPLPGESPAPFRLASSRAGATPGARIVERSDEAFTPAEDLEVRWKAEPSAAAVRVLAAGDFYAASFRPAVAPRPVPSGPVRWVFYLDTSASAADGAAHRIRGLERLLAALPATDTVELRAFDQRVVPLRTGTAAAMARQVGPLLRERLFLGGTDLEAVAHDLAARAAALPRARFVLATDGTATLGETGGDALLRAAARIPAGATVHALVLGARQDAATLRLLTRGRGRVVTVPFSDSLDARAADAARRLALPAGAAFTLDDPSAEWVLSGSLEDVQPGDEVVAVGRVRPGVAPAPRLVGSDGAILAAATAEALPAGRFGPLLEREAYRAWLDELAARERAAPTDSARRALAEEQVRLSIEHRVMIPRTTLLVLESEADYDRFGLDRRALADVLTVGAEGVEQLRRERPVLAAGMADTARSGPAGAGGTVTGRVTDEAGRPVAGAHITLDGTSRGAVTNDRGEYRLSGIAPGQHTVTAARIGLETQTRTGGLAGEAGATADFRLTPSSIALEELVVTTTGGAERQRAGAETGQVAEEALAREDNEEAEAEGEAGPPPMAPPPPPEPMPVPEPESMPAPTSPPPLQSRAPGVELRPAPMGAVDTAAAGTAPARDTAERAKRTPPAWIRPTRPTRAQADSLSAALRAAPARRDLYNRLSEALWALEDWTALRRTALAWQPYDPENPQVYEALGEAALRLGRREEARRAFASLVEVAPARPELLQRAGLLLLRAGAGEIAVAPLRRSLEQRPDRVNGYRHLALVLWQLGREPEAAEVLEDASRREFPGWYGDARRVVREELGYVYRAWMAREPARRREIEGQAAEMEVELDRTDALRVTLAWETDANDVDLHLVDPAGEECYYGHKSTETGLELYEDITRGFGPEVVRTSRLVPGTYHVGANYFSAGPMGVSRGVVVVMRPDAAGVVRDVQILPFRLVEGGSDMRLLARVEVPAPAVPAARRR